MNSYFLLPALFLCVSCASTLATTGEPGVSMGDGYKKVLEQVSKSNVIIKNQKVEGDWVIIANGYSPVTRDCRQKIFVIYEKEGLQHVQLKAAPQLSISNKCQ